MRKIPSTEAKANFAELVRRAEHGESVAITRHGRAVAHVVPADHHLAVDAFVVADSFLDLDAELYSVAAIELLSRGRARGLAPPNWQSEVRSALLEFARDKRLPEGETVKGNLDLLSDLPIDTDQEEDAQTAMDLCLTHNLPYRSGRYLELARRRGVQLATLDADLERAARAEGVDVFHAY